jgi:hypothetical protein
MATPNNLHGTICDTFNQPVAEVTVHILDKDLRKEQLLARTKTDREGVYGIEYETSQFDQAEAKSLDVFLRVFDDTGAIIGESEVTYNVPPSFTLDFKVPYRVLSEFDSLVNSINPLLENQGIKITELQENEKFKDFSFLRGETGHAFERISYLPIAFSLSDKTKIPPDIFYGLFRMNFPKELNALLLVNSESLLAGLKNAINSNIISLKWQEKLESILTDMNTLSTNFVLSNEDEEHAGLKKIISAVLPTTALQQTFLNTYFNTESTPEKFWSVLATQDGFADGKAIEEFKTALALHQLTGNEPALTTLLYHESIRNAEFKDLRGFSKLTREDWAARISELVEMGELKDFPEGIEGNTAEEKTQNYSNKLSDLIQTIYPTNVFLDRLNRDSSNDFENNKSDLITFFKNNPDFDLSTNKIDPLIEKSKMDGVNNEQALKREMKNINRLYKISSKYEVVSALRKLGLKSATDIVQQYSVDQLVQKLQPDNISREEVKAIYKKSISVDKKSTALVMAYKMRHDVPVYAISGDETIPSDYQSMFKDNNLCDCDHCQSVYSPSAYFVDILSFLKKNNGGIAFDKLTGRRPDLVDIHLTCKNTNTPLPYIDLVNELLENIVANQTTIAYQTESTAAELAAFPQNVLAAAYDKLKISAANYQLPFDLSLETARKLLEKLDLKRQGIMELLFPKSPNNIYTDVEIAKEVLNLSTGEVDILNGTIPIPGITGGISMQTVLNESQLSYVELLQAFESYFVNPLKPDETRTFQVVSSVADEPATCDISKLNVTGIDLTGLLKLIRFTRLQKKLSWSVFDVDRLLISLNIISFDLNPDEFNSTILTRIANVVRFQKRFDISVQQALSVFSLIDTSIYLDHSRDNQPVIPSFYDQLFRNKAVSNPIDPGFTALGVGLTGSITDHLPVLLSAFNISPDDLNLLLEGNNGLLLPIDDVLSIENLSELHRRVLFSSLLKLSIQDFFDAVTLIGINPLQANPQTERTLLFVDHVDFIRKGPIKLNELNYLLQNKVTDPVLSPSIESIAGKLDPIRTALKKLSNEAGSDDLITDAALRASAEALVIDKLSSVFKTDHATTRVILGQTVKFSGDPSRSFLNALLSITFFNNVAPLFTLDEFKNAIPSLPDYFNSYYHAYKIVLQVKKLKLNAEELMFFTTHAVELSIDALLNNNVPVPYAAFENIYSLVTLRNSWKSLTAPLLEVLNIVLHNEADAKSNFIGALSNATSADTATLQYLLGDPANTTNKGSLNFEFPADYSQGKNLLQLMSCFALAQKVGVGIEAFVTSVNTNNSSFLAGLLKSKYTVSKWLEVIQPISDQLRTLKRDALVAYVLNDQAMATFIIDKDIADSNSLYEYLLIDVEMDACMVTSRIKQAISSVQLFVDRGLMKLEDDVLLNREFSQQWNSWRKQYRVWEANRKVFLYPENWIESELRDDKSPFFKELESKLRQNDVTEEIAKDVLYGYLEKLDAVANLEIIGIFHDEPAAIVHVFGRTHAIPYQYFYRYQVKGAWSPWEKVEVDVEGDYVLPVVWNNRLMLFWGVFEEKQEENPLVISPGVQLPPPAKYFQVKLAWSEHKNGKWGTKKISKEVLKTPVNTVINRFQFESRIVEGKLIINLLSWLSLPNNEGFFHNLGLGAFIFDGCNSSPFVHMIGFHDPLDQTFLTVPDVSSNLMFLTENANADQKFQLFDTGIYRLNSSNSIKDIFLKSPSKAKLLSNHHEIERERAEKFFYSNKKNNFYAQSSSIFRPDFLHDISVNSSGLLVARKEVVPQDNSLSPNIKLTALAFNGTSPATVITNIGLKNETATARPFTFFFGKKYSFQTFYHPYVCSWIKTFNSAGIDGLYKEEVQNTIDTEIFNSTNYNPTQIVRQPYPLEKMDFDFSGVYALYNWELFFHIPLLIGSRLSQNQKFEEARKWFHYIFDPTKSSTDPNEGSERFWITKPFKNEIHAGILSIQDLLDEDRNPDLQRQLDYWAENPFNPHAVARLRLSAYMRTTLMKYIDNLIAWGDQLFQRDTIESINEATLLYILAGNILGKKPEKVPARAVPEEKSFANIEDVLDIFSNAKVEVESFISPSTNGDQSSDQAVMMPMFCTPKNDQLLGYWDTVSDRLFKIRHCMNIQGVVRKLELFEPPIDPGLLVRATALGLDLNSIMNETIVTLPHYRFKYILQKAYELCNDVKGLGNELLTALEKGNAEELSLIRSGHEVTMLEAIRDIKAGKVDEAKQSLESLHASRQVMDDRRDYYASRPYKNSSEDSYFNSTNKASKIQETLAVENILSSFLFAVPNVKIGSGFTIGATYGGSNLGRASGAAINAAQSTVSYLRLEGEMANIKGMYDRRQDDWKFQAKSAERELKQMDKQIAAAEIRLVMAEKELENHDLQTENSQEVNDFMRSKFSNTELYGFMVGQISSIYFQSYQMAYNISKKAEQCFQHELGLEDTTYIQFGYWDSLKKGLLSGQKLQADLRRLENAYVEQNRREFEITKHISLATLNANAILDIRKNGICTFQIPELLFEMDFPGHFFRRIKSVGLTIPCIAGPYTSVSSQLTLNKSYVRIRDENGEDLFDFTNPTPIHKLGNSSVKATATSNGQGDKGVFEFNFSDERYLPYEGGGVISEWNLELPTEARQFDYNSISDIILTIRYTARNATNAAFKTAVNTKIKEAIEASIDLLNNNGGLFRLLSMKNDFPDVFFQMKSDNRTGTVTRDLNINKSFFPYFTNNYQLLFKNCRFFKKDGSEISFPINVTNSESEIIDDSWMLTISYTPEDISVLDDIYLLIAYSLSV